MKIRTCVICGEDYQLGYNGTIHGCDSCLSVQRDAEGCPWWPEETQKTYTSIEDPLNRENWRTITREKAFSTKQPQVIDK